MSALNAWLLSFNLPLNYLIQTRGSPSNHHAALSKAKSNFLRLIRFLTEELICGLRIFAGLEEKSFFLVIYISNKRRKVIKIPNGHCYDLRYHQWSVENIFSPSPALFRSSLARFSVFSKLFFGRICHVSCHMFICHVKLTASWNNDEVLDNWHQGDHGMIFFAATMINPYFVLPPLKHVMYIVCFQIYEQWKG